MNTPYVKEYNEDGSVKYPITKMKPYLTVGKARSQRRPSKFRYMNNRKGVSILLAGKFKYFKRIQVITLKDGSKKQIEHADLKN